MRSATRRTPPSASRRPNTGKCCDFCGAVGCSGPVCGCVVDVSAIALSFLLSPVLPGIPCREAKEDHHTGQRDGTDTCSSFNKRECSTGYSSSRFCCLSSWNLPCRNVCKRYTNYGSKLLP